MAIKNEKQTRAERLLLTVRQLTSELNNGQEYSYDITLDSALDRDLGLDSLARVELLSRLEHTFNVKLSEKVLLRSESPRDLLRAVVEAEGGKHSSATFMEETVSAGPLTSEAAGAQTLLEALDWHASRHPRHIHINLYHEDELKEKITFYELWEEACSIAAGLQWRGVEPGQTVAMMLPTGRSYFSSFFGVLMAGGVPVPLYPPARPSQIEDHLFRHRSILKNSLSFLLITTAEVLPLARILKAHVETLKEVLTVDGLSGIGNQVTPHAATPETTAFLQYTSGSTGTPKGVVLTHSNLMANIRAMGEAVEARSSDVFVSWLPLYHDMGLIGAWFGSLYYGCQLVIMSPLSFLAHPESWLWAIHRHRGTLSASPNFGYEFCLKKIDTRDIEGLDLRSWRLAFNGAEPVSSETIKRFTERFGKYGFRPEAMTPVYGLAESSVGLAFPGPGEAPLIDHIQRKPFMYHGKAIPVSDQGSNCFNFVSCGRPLQGQRIRIVDSKDRELPERWQGRLQFQGSSATSGYFRNREQTTKLFHGEWLDSGDLAYMADGNLYITSRTKDIIIRGGRNIYPYELEEEIGNIKGVRKGCSVAFGSLDHKTQTESLIIVAETRESEAEPLQRLHTKINQKVTDLIGTPPDQILLVPPYTVLKTSSGKLRRSATKKLYEEKRLLKGGKAVWWQLAHLVLSGFAPLMRRTFKSLLDHSYAGYVWFLFLIMAIPVWSLVIIFPWDDMRWSLLRMATRLLNKMCCNALTVRGLDTLPKDRPVIIVANHSSYLDSFFLVSGLPIIVRFVAKVELKIFFPFRWFLSRLNVEFVERFDSEESLKCARRISENGGGSSLLFFPEGTFHRMPGLLPFHMGAFITAIETGMPIVPVSIRGTRHILPGGSWQPRRGRVTINVGTPLFAKNTTWPAAVELRDRARSEILSQVKEADLAGTRIPKNNG